MRWHLATGLLARLTALGILALGSLSLLSCAAVQPHTEGRSGPLTWQATDLQWQPLGWDSRESYNFTLRLQETAGTSLTFTKLAARLLNSPDGRPVWWEEDGQWRLPAHGDLRLPLTSSRHCPYIHCMQHGTLAPQWSITLQGTDERGNPVQYSLQVRLPAVAHVALGKL